MGDLELEKFLFDLNGYLIIEDVLSKDETLELSQLLNDHQLPAIDPDTGSCEISGGGAGAEGAGFLEFGTQFCNLLDHPKIMPALRLVLGEGFRLDHFWGAAAESGANALRLHGGGPPSARLLGLSHHLTLAAKKGDQVQLAHGSQHCKLT